MHLKIIDLHLRASGNEEPTLTVDARVGRPADELAERRSPKFTEPLVLPQVTFSLTELRKQKPKDIGAGDVIGNMSTAELLEIVQWRLQAAIEDALS